MAAPISHIALAEKVFDKFFRNRDKQKFMVGTSFPDIRYLGVIDREKTHFIKVKIQELGKETDFFAGLKFHSLVDQVREKYMQESGLYLLFPESKFLSQGVKIFEDRILHNNIGGYIKLKSYFLRIVEEEMKFGISESNLNKWHNFLINYFSDPLVGENSIREFVTVINKPVEMAEEIIRVSNCAKDMNKAKNIVQKFYDIFEELI